MKKILLLLLAIALCLPLLSACEGIGDGLPETTEKTEVRDNFEFSYEIESTSYLRGEEIRITTTVENKSGKLRDVYGFFPSIELYWLTDAGECGGKIEPNPLPFLELAPQTIKKGDIGSYTYVFPISDDAVCGEYSLKLSWDGESRVFENVLRITDVTSQNENDEYNYSPVSVSTGGESVNPIRVGTSTHVVKNGDTYMLGCDGLGVWLYLGKDKTDLSTFPLLVKYGNLEIELPEYTKIESVMIYDLQCNQIGGYASSIKDVNALPAGEYVIVLKTVYDTRPLSQTDYETTYYDDFFRLSVPKKSSRSELEKYGYSPVDVISGGVEINPLRTYLYSSYHKDGEGYEGDGLGALVLFEDKDFTYLDLPYLILTGEGGINWSHPANVTVGYVKIYRLDYSELSFDAEFLSDISKLPEGEYIVVFHEKETSDDWTYGYESVFRLIIPEQNLTESGYETTVKMLQYAWSGAGVSTKTISTCDLAYSIISALSVLPETGKIARMISIKEFGEYMNESQAERGTMWIETDGKIYRIDPEFSEICRVERHHGAGKVLEFPSELSDMIRDAWNYYPYDYYTGSYNNTTGEIEISHRFESDSTVEVKIKKFDVEKKHNTGKQSNSVTLELISSVDQKVSVRLDSAASDDNLAAGDYKEITLTKGRAESLDLTFGGWSYTYWITITVDNTRINLRIEP